ncbi:MAG: hypothetical protein JKY00_12490 [Roseicyclus sp.]|nr:hypothetical protein [Roseicyclus sp.]
MFRPAILAGVLAALPAVSSAQGIEFDGAVTFGAAFNSGEFVPGLDLTYNNYSIDFDGDLRFSEEFSLGLGFGLTSGDFDLGGSPINVDLLSLSVEPEYRFSNGAYVGAYYRMNDLDFALLGPITIGIDTTSYGVFGGYDFGQGHIEAFYGITDLGNTGALTLDIVDYGLSGAYEVTPDLEIYAAVLRSDITFFTVDLHATVFSIGADYDFGNGIGVYGAVSAANLDLSALGAPSDITATGLTLGATYDLAQSGSLPMVLSAEYSRTSLDLSGLIPGIEPDINRFAVGLTIPIGNGSSAPLNSNTRTARGDYRSALESVLQSF